jgi:aminoglycoside 6'-N-acetyltransferase I
MLERLHSDMSAREWEETLLRLIALPEPYVGFLAFDAAGRPVGMIDARIRNFAEGAPDLCAPYVEDLWVDPQNCRHGVARLLLEAVEDWAREQGRGWLGSDARLDNDESQDWHVAAGFEECERLVVFGKPLR